MNKTAMTEMNELPARERILQTAHDLFYRDGIRATGIDKVIAESGVAKATFYRHYPSKQALILAFLDYRHQRWMTWFNDALQRHGARPGGGLQPVSLAMAEWFANPLFRGCAFINIVAELADTVPDVLQISRSHKQDMAAVLATLLPENQQALATAVGVAVDGAIIKAQMDMGLDAGKQALQGLETLLQALAADIIC